MGLQGNLSAFKNNIEHYDLREMWKTWPYGRWNEEIFVPFDNFERNMKQMHR